MEITFHEAGKLLGVDVDNTGTYVNVMRPDGSLFGEGQGIVMSKDGDGITWVGQGVGRIGQDGAVSFRGAIYFQTASSKFARLNSVAMVYEHDIEPNGAHKGTYWEWK